ncbi:MAG: STAS/SEC14 domain-containing protein [Verrucomicrobiia bacterium]
MSYFIVPTDNCVFLTCEGDIPLTAMTNAWQEVQALLAEKGRERVLVDVTTMKTSPPMEALFDLAKLFWRDIPKSGRMALVVRWDQTRFAKSLEMLVRTVGIYLTVFVSEEQAEAWVGQGSQFEHTVKAFAQ